MDWWQKLLATGLIIYGSIGLFAVLLVGAIILISWINARRAAKRKYEHIVRGLKNGFIDINEARRLAESDDVIFRTVEEFWNESEQHRPDRTEVLVGQLVRPDDRDWRSRDFDDRRFGW
jgi:hypothetical protein